MTSAGKEWTPERLKEFRREWNEFMASGMAPAHQARFLMPAVPPPVQTRGAIQVCWGRPHLVTVPRRIAELMEGRSFLAGAATVRESGTEDGDRLLPFVTRIDVAAPVRDVYTADVTTWIDEDGKPAGEEAQPAVIGGEPVTATFRYILGFGGTDSPGPFAGKAAQH